MHRTLSPGPGHVSAPSVDRVSRVEERARRMVWPRRSVQGARGQGAREPAVNPARGRTRAALAIIGLLVVIVFIAAIVTTFAIAGIDLSLAVNGPGIPADFLAVVPSA